jgi:hypothetical protein
VSYLSAAASDTGSAVSALLPLTGSLLSMAYSLQPATFDLGSDTHYFFGLDSNNLNSNIQQPVTRNKNPVASNQWP